MKSTIMTAGKTATTVTNLNDLVKDVKIAEELISETICEDSSIDVWRDVEAFEGRYEVSLSGHLRFADKPSKRMVKCRQNGNYLTALLYHKGNRESTYAKIHMLVANAFVPNTEGYTSVRHKNGKLLDNRADNLEWVETEPAKKRKRKSKRTSKTISTLPSLGVSEVEVSDGGLWKDVMGYEGLYKVSKNGNVMSFWRKKPRYLTAKTYSSKRSGYLLEYQLRGKDGKNRYMMAHMLVAEHFIPNPLGYKHIMHIDGNPRNNNVDNLRWTERSVKHRVKKSETYKKFEGKHNLFTTQEVEQYYTDGTYINTFKSISEAAEKTKCSYTSIKEVLDGKLPNTGGYFWKYSGNVCKTSVIRTIVKNIYVSKASLPNWVQQADKFFTFFSEAITKVKNTIKSFFGNFQHASVLAGETTLNS